MKENNILPTDIENIIQNMTCLRKSNNKYSRDFIIICKISQEFETVKNSVEKWLISKLSNIEHPAVYDSEMKRQYAWNIVVDVCDSDDDNDAEIQFAIHLNWHNGVPMDNNGLIFLAEEPEPPQLEANIILEHLVEEPEYVIGIGVSAVSSKFIAEMWWNYIDDGQEYMIKSMWMRLPNGEWISVREKSYNFGWKNYPPN